MFSLALSIQRGCLFSHLRVVPCKLAATTAAHTRHVHMDTAALLTWIALCPSSVLPFVAAQMTPFCEIHLTPLFLVSPSSFFVPVISLCHATSPARLSHLRDQTTNLRLQFLTASSWPLSTYHQMARRGRHDSKTRCFIMCLFLCEDETT